MSTAIIASTAALLGTSAEDMFYTTYKFERLAVDGGFVELTSDQPDATFFVTLRADELGPEGVSTIESARAQLTGEVTMTGLEEGGISPYLSVKLSSPDAPGVSEKLILEHYQEPQNLQFQGDCATPTSGAACMARFQVKLSRQDNGANGGTMRFALSFDVTSSGSVSANEDSEVGPLDPPWTIDVSQQ